MTVLVSTRRERVRLESSLMFICGFWHTFDHWTRILLPFAMWSLTPRVEVHDLLLLNAFAAAATFIGTFAVAHMIEIAGQRQTAIVITAVTAIYQILLFRTTDYWMFALLQGMLFFNHIPMVLDSCVGLLEGEHGDDKRRTQLLNRLTIPMSIGIAAGPYLALKVLMYITSDLTISMTICGVLHLLTLIPLFTLIPESKTGGASKLPSPSAYINIFQNVKTKWAVLLLLMVLGPYCAYDQVVRLNLTGAIVRDPTQISWLFIVLGGTSVAVNIWLFPKLQSLYGPQTLLQAAFLLLTFSYVYLANAKDFFSLLIGMPIQVVGVSLCLGELSSQVLSSVGKDDNAKAAALIRIAHLFSVMMTPMLTGYHVDEDETSLLCYVSAVVSVAAIGIVNKFCTFMRTHSTYLPIFQEGKLN